VFNLWIDHGYAPNAGSYQYLVMPGASVADTKSRAEHSFTVELTNNERIQAVWNKHLSIAMIAFYQPGSVQTPLGQVVAGHSCLLLVRRTARGIAISAANPENQAITLHVEVGGEKISIDLPGGNFAASTVTTIVHSSEVNGK
jgi:chondroitin AC lyase